jgi:hypothetical protein
MASEQSLRTTFRVALTKAIGAHFEAQGVVGANGQPIPFLGGTIEGPQTDRDVGCVWFAGKRPNQRDGNNEEAFFTVRVLRLFKHDQGATTPREEVEAELERTFEILEDALADVLTRSWLEAASGEDLSGWADYFTVTEVIKDSPRQYVQATLTAYARNRTARGG